MGIGETPGVTDRFLKRMIGKRMVMMHLPGETDQGLRQL
jgi:hypothetical protein